MHIRQLLLIPTALCGLLMAAPLAPAEDDSAAQAAIAVEIWRPGTGVQSFFEVSEYQKCFVLGPYYRASERLWLKARLPIFFARSLTYDGAEPSASGLGDLSVQADYAWPMSAKNTHRRTSQDVVVPTGDSEKMDDGYLAPLGTGVWGDSAWAAVLAPGAPLGVSREPGGALEHG